MNHEPYRLPRLLTEEEATARAIAEDERAQKRKRAKGRTIRKKAEVMPQWHPWELDRSLLPLKPPGGRP